MKKILILAVSIFVSSLTVTHAQIPGEAPALRSLTYFNYDSRIFSSMTAVVVFHNQLAQGDSSWFMLQNTRELAQAYSYDPTLSFYAVNGFKEAFLAQQLKITAYPTTLFYQMGELVKRVEGNLYPDEIMTILEEIR